MTFLSKMTYMGVGMEFTLNQIFFKEKFSHMVESFNSKPTKFSLKPNYTPKLGKQIEAHEGKLALTPMQS